MTRSATLRTHRFSHHCSSTPDQQQSKYFHSPGCSPFRPFEGMGDEDWKERCCGTFHNVELTHNLLLHL